MSSRNDLRRNYATEIQVSLLNDDVDDFHAQFVAMKDEFESTMRWVRRTLIGVLVAISTGAVGVAVAAIILRG